jgi:hypothetical protein
MGHDQMARDQMGRDQLTPDKGIAFRTFDLFDQQRSSDRVKLVLPQPADPPPPPTNTSNLYLAPLFFFDKWNGYRYWGVFAPYPKTQQKYENPCLVVSNDAWTWIVPPGVTNPIFLKPTDEEGGGNNSDPSLVASPDGSKLYLVWTAENISDPASPGETFSEVRVSESSDGVKWSPYKGLFRFPTKSTNDLATPCLWFNGINWKCIVHNHSNAGGIGKDVQVATTSGTDIYSGWGLFSSVNMVHPGGLGWWHSHFQRVPDDRIVGDWIVGDRIKVDGSDKKVPARIIGVCQDGDDGGGDLWFAESLDDGANFHVRKAYSGAETYKYYRSAACITVGYNGAFMMELYVGTISGVFTICRELWTPGLEAKNRELAVQALVTGSEDHNFVFLDNFNRDDGPVGDPVVGTKMKVISGAFAIESGRLSTSGTDNNLALGTAPSPDYAIQATPLSEAGDTWLIFRAGDENHCWRWGYDAVGNSNKLQLLDGDPDHPVVNRQVGSPIGPDVTPEMPGGSIMKAVCRGGRIRLYINEEFCEEFADTHFASTGNKFGIQGAGAAGGVWDDLSVVSC